MAVLVDELLAEHRAQAHRDAARDLPLDHRRVDRAPDVVRGDVVEDPDVPGRAVDLDLGRVRRERV